MPGTARHKPTFRWRLEWRSALLAVSILPLFIALGFWQLSRAEEKRQINARWEQQRQQPAQPLEVLSPDPAALAYRPVSLRGEFLSGRDFLLDNRIRQGRYGVEVLSPLRLDDGTLVLVNRGWLAGDPYRQSLPAVPVAPGPVALTGYVYVPPGESYTLGDVIEGRGWPRLVQAIEMPVLSTALGETLWPFTVRLDADSPTALLAEWPIVNTGPAKHQGYAVQWFAMAAALLLLALWRNSNLSELVQARRERKQDIE